MKPVLIIAAVSQEIALLEHTLENPSRSKMPAFPTLDGIVGNMPVVICVSGVGKINAAGATAALIERHQPQLVISTGCAGAYKGSGLSIGDLAVASEEILGDEGVITSKGWLDLQGIKMPYLDLGGQRFYNEIPLSVPAAEKAVQLAESCGIALFAGRFVTVSTCSGSDQRAEELARRYAAVCENMEGAAVALTCLRYGIDCLEIRGISNLVEERNMAAWDVTRAVEAAQHFVLRYLKAMQENDWGVCR
jgi:futalosine hydrolase